MTKTACPPWRRLSPPRLAAIAVVALLTSGCASATWQDASRDAADALTDDTRDASVWARAAELALVADHDLARAHDRATRARLLSTPGSRSAARAALVLAHIQSISGQTPGLVEALAHALEDVDHPHRAEVLALAAGTTWGLNPGAIASDGPLVTALQRLAQHPGEAWQFARAAARAEIINASRLGAGAAAHEAAIHAAGVLRSWAISAPWGYATTAAYATPLGPETRALRATEATRHDLADRPVLTTFERFSDGEVVFFDLPQSRGVGFAQTTLTMTTAGADRHALLLLESNRRARVYLDGVEALSRGAQPNRDPWEQTAIVDLPDRPVRVTVKFASEEGGGFFRLRVLPHDPSGTVRTDASLAAANAFQSTAGSAPITVHPTPPRRLDRGRRLATGAAEDAVLALNRVGLLLDRPYRDVTQGRAVLGSLRRVLGPYPGLDVLAAAIAQRDSLLTKTEARQLVRERFEAVTAVWPNNRVALRGLAQVEADQERPDTALRYWQAALADDSGDLQSELGLLLHFRERSWEADALKLADTLAETRTSPRVLQEVVDTYLNFGRIRRAAEVAQVLEDTFEGAGATRLAQIASDRGDHLGAAKRLEAVLARHPERHAVLRDAVAAYRAAGDLEAAGALVEAFATRRPHDAWALSERVRIALQRGDQPAADRALNRLLDAQPDFAPMAVLQAWFQGRDQSLVTVEDAEAVVTRWRELPDADRARYASFPLVNLLENRRITVRADGSTLELRQQVRVVQSEAAADALGDFRPPNGAVLIQARTLKQDGRELLVERTEGKSDLSFRDLKPGDALETAWVVRSNVRPEEGGYLTGVTFANYNAPTLALQVDVDVAAPLMLATRPSVPEVPAPTVSAPDDDGVISWRWRARDLPPVARERGAIGGRGFFPYTDLRVVSREGTPSDTTAWRAISAFYGGRIERLTRPGPRLAKVVETLQSSVGAGERLRAWAAFAWVKEELKNSEGFNNFETAADAAVSTGAGSRAVVLQALAQELGLRSELLLCRPEVDGRPPDRDAPTPNANQFNYPLVAIQDGDRAIPYYFDVTRPYSPFDMVPPELYDARCLRPLVAAETVTATELFTALPPRAYWAGKARQGGQPALGWTFDIALTLDGEGTATGTLRGRGFGPESSALRQVYLNYDDARRETLWQHWAGIQFPGAKVISATVEEASEASRPIRWTLELSIPGYGRPDGTRMRIPALAPPLIAEDLANIPSPRELSALVERRTPLKVQEHHETADIRITPPPGYRVVTEPSTVSARGTLHAISQATTVTGGVMVVKRSVQLEVGRVMPSAYAAFRKSLDSASSAFAEGAALERITSP